MASIKEGLPPDDRVERWERPRLKVELLWEQIVQKQREIRLLELELARTDPHELAEETDPKVEG